MSPAPASWPRVSIVIPVRNEAAFIEGNLEALRRQDYPLERLEVLVADGRSEDGTPDLVRRVSERWGREGVPSALTLVDNPERVMPAGVNAAIRAARGDLVLLLGGHAALPPGYVRECVETLIGTGADGVSGALESVSRGVVGGAIAAAMSSPFGIGNSGFRTARGGGAPVPADTLPFPLFRREVYERVGLYNPHMVRHQDYEFNYRVRAAGGRMLLLPGLKATYHVRASLGGLWRQYWQYGLYKGRFLRRFPRSLRFRHLVPALFALALAGSATVALAVPPAGRAALFLFEAYALFVIAAAASFAAAGRWGAALLAPAVLPCLHLGYGFGVWFGLFRPPVPPAPRLDPRAP